jgi:mannosyl-3-phosphoglycerate phosphatase
LEIEPKKVIFSDIDGTIIDDAHNYDESVPIIDQLLEHGAILALCSSKTKGEIEFCQRKLDLNGPFIVENGGAIFIPKGYFPSEIPESKSTCEYDVVELGMPYSIVREKLTYASIKAETPTIGFGDMSVDKIAADSNLPLPLAVLAKRRMYDEPFKINQKHRRRLEDAVRAEGLTLMSGDKYFHVLGNSDKGRATNFLKRLFEKKFGNIVTFGVGSSQNDFPMLSAVNIPMLVRRKWGGRNASLPVWKNIFRFCVEPAYKAIFRTNASTG